MFILLLNSPSRTPLVLILAFYEAIYKVAVCIHLCVCVAIVPKCTSLNGHLRSCLKKDYSYRKAEYTKVKNI